MLKCETNIKNKDIRSNHERQLARNIEKPKARVAKIQNVLESLTMKSS